MSSLHSSLGRRRLLKLVLTIGLVVLAGTIILSGQQSQLVARQAAFPRSPEPEDTDPYARAVKQLEQRTTEDLERESLDVGGSIRAEQQRIDGSLEQPEVKRASIGKITISFGEQSPIYDRAIRSHDLHDRNMGYPQFVLRERLMSGLWSKHAYIFSVVAEELAKPEEQRLKWVLWLDRDTVLMNPLLRLEDFLPPANFDHIHLLAANDRHGLNNGAFFLKVNEWALKLFAYAMAFHHYVPDVPLKYTEQSAMEEILKEPWFNRSTAIVPQHWFNAFPPPAENVKLLNRHARPGCLLIHFASDRDGLRGERMTKWMDMADQQTPEWNVPFNETFYPEQFKEYWERKAKGDDVQDILKKLEKDAQS